MLQALGEVATSSREPPCQHPFPSTAPSYLLCRFAVRRKVASVALAHVLTLLPGHVRGVQVEGVVGHGGLVVLGDPRGCTTRGCATSVRQVACAGGRQRPEICRRCERTAHATSMACSRHLQIRRHLPPTDGSAKVDGLGGHTVDLLPAPGDGAEVGVLSEVGTIGVQVASRHRGVVPLRYHAGFCQVRWAAWLPVRVASALRQGRVRGEGMFRRAPASCGTCERRCEQLKQQHTWTDWAILSLSACVPLTSTAAAALAGISCMTAAHRDKLVHR